MHQEVLFLNSSQFQTLTVAGLGVKKRRNEKQHKHDGSFTTVKALPKDMLVEIFAKVATRSIFDLCMVKQCCREFLHAAEDDYVYRHASMENYALVPLQWLKESSFLKRCKESGNSEFAYREGMVQYFTYSRVELGLKNLKEAALEGDHDEAKYVYCMLLMCGEDELGQRKQGSDLLCSLKASSTSLVRCRKRVKSFVGTMWLNNKPVVPNRKSCFCGSDTSDSERLKKLSRSLRWSSFDANVALLIMNLVCFATCLES
eukprot:XP_014624990.1 F-box protein At2g35280-like [Glycine max]